MIFNFLFLNLYLFDNSFSIWFLRALHTHCHFKLFTYYSMHTVSIIAFIRIDIRMFLNFLMAASTISLSTIDNPYFSLSAIRWTVMIHFFVFLIWKIHFFFLPLILSLTNVNIAHMKINNYILFDKVSNRYVVLVSFFVFCTLTHLLSFVWRDVIYGCWAFMCCYRTWVDVLWLMSWGIIFWSIWISTILLILR